MQTRATETTRTKAKNAAPGKRARQAHEIARRLRDALGLKDAPWHATLYTGTHLVFDKIDEAMSILARLGCLAWDEVNGEAAPGMFCAYGTGSDIGRALTLLQRAQAEGDALARLVVEASDAGVIPPCAGISRSREPAPVSPGKAHARCRSTNREAGAGQACCGRCHVSASARSCKAVSSRQARASSRSQSFQFSGFSLHPKSKPAGGEKANANAAARGKAAGGKAAA